MGEEHINEGENENLSDFTAEKLLISGEAIGIMRVAFYSLNENHILAEKACEKYICFLESKIDDIKDIEELFHAISDPLFCKKFWCAINVLKITPGENPQIQVFQNFIKKCANCTLNEEDNKENKNYHSFKNMFCKKGILQVLNNSKKKQINIPEVIANSILSEENQEQASIEEKILIGIILGKFDILDERVEGKVQFIRK